VEVLQRRPHVRDKRGGEEAYFLQPASHEIAVGVMADRPYSKGPLLFFPPIYWISLKMAFL
jgi:hypothetical protein